MNEIRVELLDVNVLYGMVKTCREKSLPDMYVALAHYIHDSGREGLYEMYHDYRKFWAMHGDELLKVFPDYEAFKAQFEICVKMECVEHD